MGPSQSKWRATEATVAATASGVAGSGVSSRRRSVTRWPFLVSTTAPLMPVPPMSMPSAFIAKPSPLFPLGASSLPRPLALPLRDLRPCRSGRRRSYPRPMGDTISLADPFTVPTRHWHGLDDGRLQCDACPRACKLREGQRGRLLRAGTHRRPGRAHELRPVERVLHRPDREEAAQPLPARHLGALVRDRRVQPGLPLLPELGHLEVEGGRPHGRRGAAGVDRRRGPPSSAARRWRSPTTTRWCSSSTPSTPRPRAASRASGRWPCRPGTPPRPSGASSTRPSTRPTST